MSEGESAIYVTHEASRLASIAIALRDRGFDVVDVPAVALADRALLQKPAAIVVDAAQPGTQDALDRIEAESGHPIPVVIVGTGSADAPSTLRAEGRPFFASAAPVDAIVAELERLCSGARSRHSTEAPPLLDSMPAMAGPDLVGSLLPVPSPSGLPSVAPQSSSAPPGAASLTPSSDPSVWMHGPLAGPTSMSAALERLLAEAEQRIMAEHVSSSDIPSPDEEVDGLLPPDVLAALDEPLEAPLQPASSADVPSVRTPTGTGTGAQRTHGARHTGTGATNVRGATAAGTHEERLVETGEYEAGDDDEDDAAPEEKAQDVGAEPEYEAESDEEAEPEDEAERPTPPPVAVFARGDAPTRPPSHGPPRVPLDGRLPHRVPPEGPDADASLDEASDEDDEGTPTPAPAALLGPPSLGSSMAPVSSPIPAIPPLPPVPLIQPVAPPVAPMAKSEQRPAPPVVSAAQVERLAPVAPPAASPEPAAVPSGLPEVLSPQYDGLRVLAVCIAARATLTLCFEEGSALRRAVLRDGDFVACSSSSPEESLVSFLVARGDLTKDIGVRLGTRLPPFGRHAAAALIANGHLAQDQLWLVLRAHAEWVLGKMAQTRSGVCAVEREPPGRLKAEPAVFGGATGAEVLVEVALRVIAPDDAVKRLGGPKARLAEGPRPELLAECALAEHDRNAVSAAAGSSVREAIATSGRDDLAPVLAAMVELGVLQALAAVGRDSVPADHAEVDRLDAEAVRRRVKARMDVVQEGDYFEILGVSQQATGYEIRRAYLEMRRAFEPSRLLTAATADLSDDVQLLLEVVEEAWEALRDPARRGRYLAALQARPPQ